MSALVVIATIENIIFEFISKPVSEESCSFTAAHPQPCSSNQATNQPPHNETNYASMHAKLLHRAKHEEREGQF